MQVLVNATTIKVVSSLTLDSVRNAEKFVPSALVIKNEKGDTLYKVSTSDVDATLRTYGVAFNTHQQGSLAVAYAVRLSDTDDLQAVADQFMTQNAQSLAALAKYEGMVAAQIEMELEPITAAMSAVVIEE